MVFSPDARHIRVNGIVQGVGFRPFVYHLARSLNLAGEVSNTSSGVRIHAEGPSSVLDAFERDLREKAPPLAHVTEVASEPAPLRGLESFTILVSHGEGKTATLISPDVAVCADCLREMFDPADRRHRYPFINCTNCGPRYTIIDDIPYDRPKTSMRAFRMCPACQAEYDDPADRRFHAQPNACPVCGPRVSLFDARRRPVETDDPIAAVVDLLLAGHVLAIKGLGGFHLAADALNEEAVALLRRRKHRAEKPFALMVPDLDAAKSLARVSPEEEAPLSSIQRPIVLLDKREDALVAASVAPRNACLGIMLPYTPLHHLILGPRPGRPATDRPFTALVMTSANMSEEPIVIGNDESFARLSGLADFLLIHDRDIYLRSDDSIVRHAAGAIRPMRRSRGYAPMPVFLNRKLPHVLGVGPELKATVCLAKNDTAFPSQHIGDMENLETEEFFRLTVRHLQRILNIRPEIVAHDLHPDYRSTRLALESTDGSTDDGDIPADAVRIGVQHHHAHIVSCMAEHRVDGPVIGLAFDGTGYGMDGAIWGGEILVAEPHRFERAAHLSYIPMPGGTTAIREPWRMALACLRDAFGPDGVNPDWLRAELPGSPLSRRPASDIALLGRMMDMGLNAPPTSSLGRLFDAVAALAGVRDTVTFEGQAAMELEMISAPESALSGDRDAYAWEWTKETPPAGPAGTPHPGRGGGYPGRRSRAPHRGALSPDLDPRVDGARRGNPARNGYRPRGPERRRVSEPPVIGGIDDVPDRAGIPGPGAYPGAHQRRRGIVGAGGGRRGHAGTAVR